MNPLGEKNWDLQVSVYNSDSTVLLKTYIF